MRTLGSWELVGARYGGTVAGLAASPDYARDHTFFAAGMGGLFRSRDGAKTWQPLGQGLPGPFLTSIVVSPAFAEDGVLLAASLEGGVFHSADGGRTWSQGDFRGRPVNVTALEISPDFYRDGVAFAGTMADGIFRSTDRGASWESCSFGLLDLNVQDLEASPEFAKDETLFAATTSGVFHSQNGGRAWRELPFPSQAGSVQCLAASSGFAVDGALFAGTEAAGIFLSTDRGRTWQALGDSLGDECVNCLETSPDFTQDRTLLAATNSGIYVSRDAGAELQRCADLRGALCLALAPNFAAGGPAVVGLPREGVYRSTEGLANWQPANDGLSGRVLAGLAFSPHFAADRGLFAFGPSEGVIRSADAGASWTDVGADLPSLRVDDLASAPARNGEANLYAAAPRGLWINRRGGENWEQLTDLPVQRLKLSEGFPQDGTLLVGTKGQGLWLSRDAGQSWERVEVPWDSHEYLALALSPEFASDEQLFAIVGEPEAERVDVWQGGIATRWQRVIRYKGAARGAILAVAATYPQDGRWYASIGAQLFRTQTGRKGRRSRESTERLALAEERPTVLDLAVIDEPRPGLLLAATDRGAYASVDGGNAWRLIDEGLPARPIVAIAASPDYAQDRAIYALELGGNLWRSNRSD